MSINYEYYRVFYYVAKYQSISKAGKVLHLTQPTISHHIQALEDSLGVPLFIRSRNGVSMTAEAKIIFDNVKHAVAHFAKAEDDLKSYLSMDYGTVYTVTTETGFFTAILPIMAEFNKKHPGISINISSDYSRPAIDRLQDNLADFIIITDPIAKQIPSNMTLERLIPIKDILVCGEKYIHLTKEKQTLESLKSYPFINNTIRQSSGYSSELSSYFINNLTDRGEISTELYSYKRYLIMENVGIGTVPDRMAKNDIEKGLLFEIPLQSPLPIRYVNLLYRNDIEMNYIASQMVTMIKDYAEKETVE